MPHRLPAAIARRLRSRPRRGGSVGPWIVLLLLLLPGPAAAEGAPCEAKTVSFKARSIEGRGTVELAWTGEVRNAGPSSASIRVRLVARDSRWDPVAFLEVPAVEVGPRASVREEAVFEIEQAVWRRIYTVDPEASVEGPGGGT